MDLSDGEYLGVPIDPDVIDDVFIGVLRSPNLDTDPATFQIVRYEPANLDPEAGSIDFTPTPQVTLNLECREEPNPFDGLVQSCPTMNN